MSSADDSTDEEYKPEGEESDIPSEAETDYDSDGNKVDKSVANKKRKRRQSLTTPAKQRKVEEKPVVDEEAEKRHQDAVWVDFLNDTSSTTSKEKENVESSSSKNPTTAEAKAAVVTKIFEFAGEQIKVKTSAVAAPPQMSASASSDKPGPNRRFSGAKLPTPRRGLGSVMSQLGKKDKLSVLEKTKLDWNSYKHEEGIEEELQTHNKGKDGFLERQDFLERTDLRQFEIEKHMRQTRRSNR